MPEDAETVSMFSKLLSAERWQLDTAICESRDSIEALRRPTYSDIGNAQRLAMRHGDDLRYSPQLGEWLVWDGKRWAVDRTFEVERRAKETVLAMFRVATATTDEDKRKKFVAFAMRSLGEPKVRAMIKLARSEPGIAVSAAQLDADPWLLNVSNGTLDLKTGVLRPHRRTDLLTKLAPVEYDAEAHSDVWERFLDQLTGGDRELRDYLQRSVGYSLTGATSEEVMFLVLGPGGSGKSTLVEAIKATFGDYVRTSDFETFLKRSASGAPRNDIARLNGARLVIACEVDEGKALAEGVVKTLTGSDTVTARYLYKEAFEFKPKFKLWLVANHAPEVSAFDSGMWRRIRQIPCRHALADDEQDPKVAGPAILKWAVDGCLAWQKEGRLRVPKAIVDATACYRADMDPLKDFIEEHCELAEGRSWASAQLFEAYREWADRNRIRPQSQKKLAEALRAYGCTSGKISTGAWKGRVRWSGIGPIDAYAGVPGATDALERVMAGQDA
jgi:putative DNA primase/helicase